MRFQLRHGPKKMQKKRITSALPSVPYPRHVEPIDDLITGGFQLFLSPRSGLIGETRVLL